jgi:hypothetical protein
MSTPTTRPVSPVALAARKLSVPEPLPGSRIVPRLDRGQVEEVADPGERIDRGAGDRVEVGRPVAEPLGQRAAGLEVELAVRFERDLLVH